LQMNILQGFFNDVATKFIEQKFKATYS
jgi:hypothetical protein